MIAHKDPHCNQVIIHIIMSKLHKKVYSVKIYDLTVEILKAKERDGGSEVLHNHSQSKLQKLQILSVSRS